MFTFSQLIASIAESVQQRLECLPTQILSLIIVIAGAVLVVVFVFRLLIKNKQSIQIGSISIPSWVVPSFISIALVLVLLLSR